MSGEPSRRLMKAIIEQVYNSDPLFFRALKDRPPVHGPPTPVLSVGDLTVDYCLKHPRCLEFFSGGWEGEVAHLSRGEVSKLIDNLERWVS